MSVRLSVCLYVCPFIAEEPRKRSVECEVVSVKQFFRKLQAPIPEANKHIH